MTIARLIAASALAAAIALPGSASAEGEGRQPAGGAFMSTYSSQIFAPPAFDADFDADFAAPPRALLFAALLPADLDADLPAPFDAPPLLDFDVVAFAITTSLREPHARP